MTIRSAQRAVRNAFAVTLATLLCWASPMPFAAAGDVLRSNDIACRLGLKPCGKKRGIVVGKADDGGPGRVALSAIQFEFDSDRLTPAAREQLEELGKALGSAPASLRHSFAIQGHTDSAGEAAYNRSLSLRRARAVKRYLMDETGMPGRRLVEIGLGESYPVAGLTPADGRNRRVEIVNLGADVAQPRVRRALLVGIDDYRQVSRLEGPVNDARAMASFAADGMGFARRDIKLLLNGEATRDGILTAIEDWLVEGTKPGDEVFLFFSGHGFQQPDKDGDEEDGMDETLVPVGAFVTAGTVKGMITDDEIAALMDRLSGRRVLVVIDACHSGTVTRSIGDWRQVKTPRLPDGSPIRVARTRGVAVGDPLPQAMSFNDPGARENLDLTVWAAVRPEEKALVDAEAGEEPGSVFTRRLLWGARDGKADWDRDGVVTAAELHEYVLEESQSYCERHADVCQGLTPQLDAGWGRDKAPAFGDPPPRTASIAKDILVRTSSLPEPSEGGTEGLRLRIDPGPRLELGAALDIVVESDRDGHLVLLDINAAGDVVQIFPNERSLAGGVPDRIRAGIPMRLPGNKAGFRFRTVPPIGKGRLIAVLSEGNAPLRDVVSRHKDLSVVQRPEAYLVEVGEALRAGSSNGGRGGWRTATLPYEIVSRKSEGRSSTGAR